MDSNVWRVFHISLHRGLVTVAFFGACVISCIPMEASCAVDENIAQDLWNRATQINQVVKTPTRIV
jgi:hypothetical protein